MDNGRLAVDGAELYHEVRGAGPALLMISGAGTGPLPAATADSGGLRPHRCASTRNSLPSGSVSSTAPSWPWAESRRFAPRESRRSTSAC